MRMNPVYTLDLVLAAGDRTSRIANEPPITPISNKYICAAAPGPSRGVTGIDSRDDAGCCTAIHALYI